MKEVEVLVETEAVVVVTLEVEADELGFAGVCCEVLVFIEDDAVMVDVDDSEAVEARFAVDDSKAVELVESDVKTVGLEVVAVAFRVTVAGIRVELGDSEVITADASGRSSWE